MNGPPQLPATMLVDLPNWVGDQMMAMPALNRLVEGNHGGETVLHTRPSMTRLLSAVFPETRVISSPRKASPFSCARRVRDGGRRFKIGVTLRNAARGKILIRLGSRWCAGSRGEGALLLLSASCRADRSLHQIHDADSILAVLGLEPADPFWRPDLPDIIEAEGGAVLRTVGVDGERAIGLAPSTARGDAKRWPVRRYGELAARCRARGYQPVVVIGPGEEAVADELNRAARYACPVVGGNADVAGLAAVAAGCRLLVGNDSGPVQLAARIGTPVVALFGPTDPNRTAPLGPEHRVLSPPSGRDDRMQGISVDEVEAAIFDLVQQRQ
jgi:heptosyltransferase-2